MNTKGKHLEHRRTAKTLETLRERVGLEVTLHGLRSTAITYWTTVRGMPSKLAQMMFGHENLATTEGYMRPKTTQLGEWMLQNQVEASSKETTSADELLLLQLLSKRL